ncbi:MAG TPA: twin-arginine translocase subunit TatC [Anaerolineales bacterium]|nr:twin-arginine translocase subunit TatC [Anaerolineales bacterium]
MRKFFQGVWRVISFPFRLVFNIIAFPFRAIRRFNTFLNTEPDEHPITEIFADIVTQKETRDMLWDQVDAFRMHLLRAVLALTITVLISFTFSRNLAFLLARPLGAEMSLETIEITEGIGIFMKVALMSGIALALPYIIFEAWLFAAPGLRPREKKYGLIGIPFATLLFISGAVFTFYILPAAFGAIRQFNDYMGFVTKWTPNSYYSFVTNLMVWMGVFFEFPLVIYVLTSMGLVQPKFLAEQWRLAVVIISILAAAVTPTVDPVNMGLVMAPMILLYFISIGLSYVAYAGRSQNKTGELDQAGDEGAG